ncbi:hypothetical protein E1281_29740 [Actinomadura sp. KC345]|uniref:hypothetical protein n=1 Tax=Actinomadura sp. KC345 TaxID=2530371 RepID=UPI00104635B9|nr:hypothetical protein [Actinomadura sp. KC345]TDC45653.1 hypothetical protein E1281_29740 [Actinomadura sp. KC345]
MGRFKNAIRVAGKGLWGVLVVLVAIARWIIGLLLLGLAITTVPYVLYALWHFMGLYGLILLAVLITLIVWIAKRSRSSKRLPSNERARH